MGARVAVWAVGLLLTMVTVLTGASFWFGLLGLALMALGVWLTREGGGREP